jgi:hypothetical protein
MRDRLIELIKEHIRSLHLCDSATYFFEGGVKSIADHLLANGVIVPPMALGQTCYNLCAYRNDIDECRVSSITQKADGTLKIRLTYLRSRCVYEIKPNEIGKTVFLTREEAEQALAKMKGEGK